MKRENPVGGKVDRDGGRARGWGDGDGGVKDSGWTVEWSLIGSKAHYTGRWGLML